MPLARCLFQHYTQPRIEMQDGFYILYIPMILTLFESL